MFETAIPFLLVKPSHLRVQNMTWAQQIGPTISHNRIWIVWTISWEWSWIQNVGMWSEALLFGSNAALRPYWNICTAPAGSWSVCNWCCRSMVFHSCNGLRPCARGSEHEESCIAVGTLVSGWWDLTVNLHDRDAVKVGFWRWFH